MSTDSDTHDYWPTPSIETYTGIEFFPLDPDPSMIHQHDIAHALALKCRYTGHCEFFFSVAQHCVLMYDYMRFTRKSITCQKWALMHDASEAYLPDVAGPVKKHIVGFIEIEDRVLVAVAERFNLPWPKGADVTRLDRLMYWHERTVLLKPAPWLPHHSTALDVPDAMRKTIPLEHWTPQRAEQEWWDRFTEAFPEEKDPW